MGIIIRGILITLITIIAIIVIVGLFLPTEYNVSRSVVIDASPEVIHEYVGDLKRWDTWEPWTEDDSSIAITYGEKTSGAGASQTWTGKDGGGSLTFTSSSPTNGIKYDLSFDEGKYDCKSSMLYEPQEEGEALVTWRMKGDMNTPVVGAYFALMMDSMVGPMFDRGLEKLKNQVEGE